MSPPQLREGLRSVSSWPCGRVFCVLRPLQAELSGELVAEGAVLGSQAVDLVSGGIESLAKRVRACMLRGECGGRRLVVTQLADEVPELVLAVEPCPGDAGCVCDCGVVHGLSVASQLLYGAVGCRERCLVAPGVGLREE
jgi:hypothetical protein